MRYLGPAVTLQRSCLNAVCHGGFAAGYDFPQRSMIAVYRRLRIPVADELVTFERIVRLDRMLQNRIRPRPLGTILAAVGNPLLALAGRPRRRGAELVIEAGPVACSQEFDELAVRTAGSFGIHVARTAEYLNWRFLNHFHNRYEMVVARRNRRLAGYLVLLDDPSNDQLNIMDCLTEPEPPVWIELLAGAVQLCRERQRSVLAISLLSKDSRAAELRASRFVARRTLPCILHMSPEISGSRLQGSVGSAGFTYGDEAD